MGRAMKEELISGRWGEAREKHDLWSNSRRELLFQYVIITIGAAIFGAALAMFMLPYKIAPGGVAGLVVILAHLFTWPPGILLLCFNIPIFFLGMRSLGYGFGLKSLCGTVLISVFTDLCYEVLHLQLRIDNPILVPVFGGVVMGVGLGLIIKMGGATSGSGTIARIIARYTNITHGTAILIINSIIIGLAGFAFQDADKAMYGMLSLWISSKVIDALMEGMDYARGVYIITNKTDEISRVILDNLGRGGTALKARGLYTNADREVIFCVITRKELPEITKLIKKIDPRAFTVITPVHEVLGEGFRERV